MREIIIDKAALNLKPNMLYRGAGMVSANNSSRLLLDYKAENPAAYRKILELIFGKNGVGVNHLKLEMGSDINSSSGTEPCIMRSADETPDVTRGAGFMLAADAKKINPDLTLDMLPWSEPRWVTDAQDVYAARYKWYKSTLDAAYDTYGLKFDYVSAVRNERAADCEWVIYLSERLKSETDCRYDYSAIKIVGGEEVCTWGFADRMLEDERLRNAVDVVGSHYTSSSTPAAQELAERFGKELWLSEGCAPMNYVCGVPPQSLRLNEKFPSRLFTRRKGLSADQKSPSGLSPEGKEHRLGGGGLNPQSLRLKEKSPSGLSPEGKERRLGGATLSGLNGTLDIAGRITAMYPMGKMTLYEYQPVVSAYYDGVCYCQKQLISACDPWSGYFALDSGFYMSLHFSQFIKKGWAFAEGACYSDGKVGGDGHALVDAVFSYTTAADPESGDYSTVITNTSAEPVEYLFRVKGLGKASSAVNVWETRGPDSGSYDENYFRKTAEITPTESGGEYTYTVTVKPYSMVTVSTLSPALTQYQSKNEAERTVLPLPYEDDFEYAGYPSEYLASRGNAPRYTTDQGGAFEVRKTQRGNMLVQLITAAEKADEWGWTPEPVTCFGDDRWYNYSVTAQVLLDRSDKPTENYAGAGLRYILPCNGASGYWIKLAEDGCFSLMANNTEISGGKLSDFDPDIMHELKITAVNNVITARVDGVTAAEYVCGGALIGAGRAALYSSYNKNSFGSVLVEPANGAVFISRFDNTDSCFEYEGDWEHDMMSSYRNYKRTISTGRQGAVVTVNFVGTGFALTGESAGEAVLSVVTDGGEARTVTAFKTGSREISCRIDGLEKGTHTARITVLEGVFGVDGMEVVGGNVPYPENKEEA